MKNKIIKKFLKDSYYIADLIFMLSIRLIENSKFPWIIADVLIRNYLKDITELNSKDQTDFL